MVRIRRLKIVIIKYFIIIQYFWKNIWYKIQ
nr:MAG TPA: hypothetical protein [Caudoviricetes sp.]